MNFTTTISSLLPTQNGNTMPNLSWISGLREVFVKDPTGNRVGYFTHLSKALAAVGDGGEYQAVWFSLNICPGVPAGFEPNRLYKASGRFKKTDYACRQLLLVDCDPKRPADTASTDLQKAAAKVQVLAISGLLAQPGLSRGNSLRLSKRISFALRAQRTE
jgi:hypothetical protein